MWASTKFYLLSILFFQGISYLVPGKFLYSMIDSISGSSLEKYVEEAAKQLGNRLKTNIDKIPIYEGK